LFLPASPPVGAFTAITLPVRSGKSVFSTIESQAHRYNFQRETIHFYSEKVHFLAEKVLRLSEMNRFDWELACCMWSLKHFQWPPDNCPMEIVRWRCEIGFFYHAVNFFSPEMNLFSQEIFHS
jgi:hypothetical protein